MAYNPPPSSPYHHHPVLNTNSAVAVSRPDQVAVQLAGILSATAPFVSPAVRLAHPADAIAQAQAGGPGLFLSSKELQALSVFSSLNGVSAASLGAYSLDLQQQQQAAAAAAVAVAHAQHQQQQHQQQAPGNGGMPRGMMTNNAMPYPFGQPSSDSGVSSGVAGTQLNSSAGPNANVLMQRHVVSSSQIPNPIPHGQSSQPDTQRTSTEATMDLVGRAGVPPAPFRPIYSTSTTTSSPPTTTQQFVPIKPMPPRVMRAPVPYTGVIPPNKNPILKSMTPLPALLSSPAPILPSSSPSNSRAFAQRPIFPMLSTPSTPVAPTTHTFTLDLASVSPSHRSTGYSSHPVTPAISYPPPSPLPIALFTPAATQPNPTPESNRQSSNSLPMPPASPSLQYSYRPESDSVSSSRRYTVGPSSCVQSSSVDMTDTRTEPYTAAGDAYEQHSPETSVQRRTRSAMLGTRGGAGGNSIKDKADVIILSDNASSSDPLPAAECASYGMSSSRTDGLDPQGRITDLGTDQPVDSLDTMSNRYERFEESMPQADSPGATPFKKKHTGPVVVETAMLECALCDKKWQVDPSDPNEVIFPDKYGVLPPKCPKCCKLSFSGVCYVVESESKQGLDKKSTIKPLPPVIYAPQYLRPKPSQYLTDCFYKIIKHGRACMTSMHADLHNHLLERKYLLHPGLRKELLETIDIVDGIEHASDQFDDNRFVVLHYKYDPYLVLRPCLVDRDPETTRAQKDETKATTSDSELMQYYDAYRSIERSDIQIGLLVRRGTNRKLSGIKANNTWNIRLDLYVTHQSLWDELSPERQHELRYIQQLVEDAFLVLFKSWNIERVRKERSFKRTGLRSSQAQQQQTTPPDSTEAEASTSSPQSVPASSSHRSFPCYLSPMRDVFRIQLIPVTTPCDVTVDNAKRTCNKTVWYFPKTNLPENYDPKVFCPSDYSCGWGETDFGYPVGVTTYDFLFNKDEIRRIETCADIMDEEARGGKYDIYPHTYQVTKKGDRLCRTKFFFSARYLWTKNQMEQADAAIAEGIRADVAEPPPWMRMLVEQPLVDSNIVDSHFVNEFAMNIYHDGTEGLKQHFDDSNRFARPIFSLRLYSDSRLAFGSKDFSMTNSLFFIPMMRGCITVLEKGGYGADGIKHCIRPADMGGKSGVVLMRQIHKEVLEEAVQMQRENEIEKWLNSIPDLETPRQYVQAFLNEGMKLSSLVYLHECDLKMLGLTKMGPRKVIMHAIEQLRDKLGVIVAPHMSCSCTCYEHTQKCRYEKNGQNGTSPSAQYQLNLFHQQHQFEKFRRFRMGLDTPPNVHRNGSNGFFTPPGGNRTIKSRSQPIVRPRKLDMEEELHAEEELNKSVKEMKKDKRKKKKKPKRKGKRQGDKGITEDKENIGQGKRARLSSSAEDRTSKVNDKKVVDIAQEGELADDDEAGYELTYWVKKAEQKEKKMKIKRDANRLQRTPLATIQPTSGLATTGSTVTPPSTTSSQQQDQPGVSPARMLESKIL